MCTGESPAGAVVAVASGIYKQRSSEREVS